ncbi:MAG: hypothetical protein K2K48_05255 [Anaeroplasmataceae bacterium]|nr:hypothetical protein [Anaeroplasmataceae bacterium]
MKLQIFGDYVLEFFVVTILLILSLALVIPFIPMVVGVTGYFKRDINSRRFKDIFSTMKENWKILIFYTVFQLIILVASILNIFYFNSHLETKFYFILIVSYIALIIGIFYLITAPTIIVNMNVTFRQLLYNGFMLLMGNLKNTIFALVLAALVVVLILYFPYVIPLMFYFVTLVSQKLMSENFLRLKAKALGVRVEDLRKESEEDEFLSEIDNQ